MKKWLFALGLILLFVGIIFTSSAVQSEKTIKEKEELIKSEIDSWQISSNLTQGDKVRLSVAQGEDWDRYVEPAVEDVPFPHKFVYVNITDPNGEDSMFEVTYTKYEAGFFLYNVRVVASNGFDAENSSQKIVGYARDTGLYTATATGAIPPGGGPPSSLTFFKVKEVILIKYPYSHLLYPGVAILLAGVALSILGALTSKRVQHKRRTRVKSRYAKSF